MRWVLRNIYGDDLSDGLPMVVAAIQRLAQGRLAMLSLLIGCAGAFPQCLRGQESSVEILTIPAHDEDLRRVFANLFRSDHEIDWQSGWRRARSLGMSAVPVLADLWRNQTPNPWDRQLLISAVGLAAGVSGEDFLLDILNDRDRPLRERVMSHLSMALGYERPGSGTSMDRLLGFTSRVLAEPILSVSACLALRQFRGSGQAPRAWYQHQDAGIAAAAQFSHPTSLPKRWLRRDRKHRDLVLRGFLLGDSDSASRQAQALRAVAVLESDELMADLQLAAALNLSRTGGSFELGTIFARPSLKEFLPALVETPVMRQRLLRLGLISARPERRLSPDLRARLALAYALEVDLEELGQNIEEWSRDDRVAAATCLGLAWRLSQQPEAWSDRHVENLPDLVEAEWVRLALGQDALHRQSEFLDPALQRAFALAIEGRLPADAIGIAIENSLWRRGWHLGLTRREAEHALIADLMFAGSEYGASKLLLGPNARAYLPKGIPARDAFFRIAYQFFAFVREPGPRVVVGYGLR